MITPKQAEDWIKASPKNKDVLKLFSMGSNLAKNPHGIPERWIIDFSNRSLEEVIVIASEDFYIFGILTSNIHRTWMQAQKSTLKADIAYTHKTCFETFPFPQNPHPKIVQQIRETAIELHEYRSQQMEKKQWGITTLYNTFFAETSSNLYKLHEKLNQQVMKAYKFKKSDDILEKLLELNQQLAEQENLGHNIIGPWSPSN